ncbi:ProC Pyrroline-5-carboxylate reductase [Candidatus Pelagibacterales bacterium]
MKLGFIGVGKIATSVIEGIFNSKINIKEIILSPKNRQNTNSLRNKFKKIKIAKSNQDVLDKSNWVVLSITPKVGKQILKKLKFKKNHIVLNFMSTIHNQELKKIIFPARQIFKIAPLPMIKYNVGPIIIYPKNKTIENFFNKLGKVVSTSNEKENKKLWVMTSFMATYFEIFNTAHKWFLRKGINKNKSMEYLIHLFKALNNETIKNSNYSMDKMIKEFQTKGGINEELLNKAKKSGVFKNLNKGFDKIYNRVK